MNYSLTVFKSIFDNRTDRTMDFSSWDEFVELLRDLSKERAYKPKKGEKISKNAAPLISPAMFAHGEKRRNVNVIEWAGWCCLDVDDYEGTFEDALDKFKEYRYVCYSTASSSDTQKKFRIVLPLTANVESSMIKHFWFALNKKFNELGDPQTKDLCRMYYIPAKYPGARNFFIEHDGKELNPYELTNEFPFVAPVNSFAASLPNGLQKKVIDYRLRSLKNTDYNWSSYRDCPFVKQSLVGEYCLISGSGWYAKMYSIMLSIAGSAIRSGYPITAAEIATLCRQIDSETGNWYSNRPFEVEAQRALDFALFNS